MYIRPLKKWRCITIAVLENENAHKNRARSGQGFGTGRLLMIG